MNYNYICESQLRYNYKITVSDAYVISNNGSIVTAIPIAGPFTTAIKSLGYVINMSTNFL